MTAPAAPRETDAPEKNRERPVILVTRPAEDAEPLMAALDELGYAPLLVPMLRIVPRDDAAFDLGDAAGLLFTSANGVRALVRRAESAGNLPQALTLPVYAVGDATARTARAAGFIDVASAGGDVQALAALTAARRRPQDGPLLHVAGTDVAGDLAGLLSAQGFNIRRATLYQALAAGALPGEALAALCDGRAAGAVFFSPRTARSFVTLAVDAGETNLCRHAVAYCLSPAVADALRFGGGASAASIEPMEPIDPLGWKAVSTAAAPDQKSLLALLSTATLR